MQTDKIVLKADDQSLSQTDTTPYLGVDLDQYLGFIPQFEKQLAKINRSVGVLKRVSLSIPMDTRKTLYTTIILPHIDYCSPVWSSLPDYCIVRLQRSQNRAMRLILDSDHRSHVKPMLDLLKFQSINQRFLYNNYVQMWNIVYGQTPTHLSKNFKLQSEQERQTSSTRSMSTLDIYTVRRLTRAHSKRVERLPRTNYHIRFKVSIKFIISK